MRVAETLSIAFFALALVGCAHAKTTEPTEPAKPEAAEKPSSTERAPRSGKLRVAPTGDQPKTTPLAQAPEGLLTPGAEQKIHDKLSAGGLYERGYERLDRGGAPSFSGHARSSVDRRPRSRDRSKAGT